MCRPLTRDLAQRRHPVLHLNLTVK